jgi:hypothetical protein
MVATHETDVSAAVAASVFAVLALLVAAFQLALAAGMPWGKLTWGGKFPGTLPVYMRAVAVTSAVLAVAFGLTVAIRAGILLREWQPISRKLIWVVVAYCAIGVVANAATPSGSERRVWLPVVFVMLVSGLIVAMS